MAEHTPHRLPDVIARSCRLGARAASPARDTRHQHLSGEAVYRLPNRGDLIEHLVEAASLAEHALDTSELSLKAPHAVKEPGRRCTGRVHLAIVHITRAHVPGPHSTSTAAWIVPASVIPCCTTAYAISAVP